jgi:hypothetical protein
MTKELAPRGGFEPPTFRLTAEQPISSELAGVALIEGNQQVATKPDESLSPYSPFVRVLSPFTTISITFL